MRRFLIALALWMGASSAAFAQAPANCVVVNGVSQCANGVVFNGGLTIAVGQAITLGTDTTLSRAAAGKVTLTGTTPMLQLGGTTASFPALKQVSAQIQFRLADDSNYAPIVASTVQAAGTLIVGNNLTTSAVPPTISSGFGTSPSIVNNNGTAAFTVNVGTGGVATSGVIGLVTAANGWNCFVIDRTNNTVTRETATTTTTVTLTAAAAWAASDILQVSCFAY